ncbi:MAG TPA: tetratricopeptide repeat protein [Verrucomicrobiae bacterium]|nr:tetratricopeptide repeat protein [Verrucomicrobiae bacterium]
MRARDHFKISGFLLILSMVVGLRAMGGKASAADNTNAVSDAEGKVAEAALITNQESIRSNLQIQEQLHDTLLAIEKNRQEAEAAAARNAKMLEERLNLMEKTLAEQRSNYLSDIERADRMMNIEHTDRMMMMVSGGFAAIGFVVLLAAAFLQWAGANRLATLAAALPDRRPTPVLGFDETKLLASSQAMEQSNARFLSIIERLEQRIQAMEITPKSPQHLPEASSTNGAEKSVEILAVAESAATTTEPASSADTDKAEAARLLLAKGQTLLKLDKPQEALDCFDEVLALDPEHADALVKKGAALERLQRLDEAIECYDLAIARDNSLTMAYLYKGGVFNRMERYSEALACYELALKSQQKGHAANVIID